METDSKRISCHLSSREKKIGNAQILLERQKPERSLTETGLPYSRAVVLTPSNAVTLQHSCSWCGDPQP